MLISRVIVSFHKPFLDNLARAKKFTFLCCLIFFIKQKHLPTYHLLTTTHQFMNETVEADFNGIHFYFRTTACCLWRLSYWFFCAYRSVQDPVHIGIWYWPHLKVIMWTAKQKTSELSMRCEHRLVATLMSFNCCFAFVLSHTICGQCGRVYYKRLSISLYQHSTFFTSASEYFTFLFLKHFFRCFKKAHKTGDPDATENINAKKKSEMPCEATYGPVLA